MISELIQKMQALSSEDGNYNYEVRLLEPNEINHDDTMVHFDCTYNEASQIAGMLNTRFNLDKTKKNFPIGIVRVAR